MLRTCEFFIRKPYIALTSPFNGSINYDLSGTITYIPIANFIGIDSFRYAVCDNQSPALCDSALVTIEVLAPSPLLNLAPFAEDDAKARLMNTAITSNVAVNDYDVENDPLTFSPLTNPPNGTLVFNTNGTYSYTPNLNFTGTDQFIYTICDATGCDTATVYLSFLPPSCSAGTTAPSVSATTLSNICPTTTVDLNSLVTSATPSGARLRWHTVSTNPTAADFVATSSVLTASGTYYAYYFDAANNCYSPATAAVTVTINTSPAAPTTTVSQPTCAVATGTITVTAPTSGVTYSFDNGATYQPSNIKSGLAAATTYQVLVKDDATNCVSTATPSVINAALSVPNAPTTTVSPPTCAVSTGLITVTIPASGVTYSFNNGTTYQATATSNALASGTYQVVVKDAVSNCVSMANATVINGQPATPVISLVAKGDPPVSSCPMLNNGTISVTATGSNLLYSKDNGATWQANNVFSLLTAGSYTIKVKDSGTNCEVVYATNPVVLTAQSCATGCIVPKPSITGH